MVAPARGSLVDVFTVPDILPVVTWAVATEPKKTQMSSRNRYIFLMSEQLFSEQRCGIKQLGRGGIH
jgi:hypothetical protein